MTVQARDEDGIIVAMPSLSTLMVFSVAALSLFVVPGPAVLYIVARSVEQGRRAGFVSILGVHTGSLVHVAAAAVGLSALLATSAVAFTVVKLAGAAYLIALGIRHLRARPDSESVGERAPLPLRGIYRQGLIVNLLNPKTALFFLAFLPQFIEPARGPAAAQIGVLGVVFVLVGLCSDGMYALLAGTLSDRLRDSPVVTRLRERISGTIYLALGVLALRARRVAT